MLSWLQQTLPYLFAQAPDGGKRWLRRYLVSQGWVCPCFQEQRDCLNISAEHSHVECRGPVLGEKDSVCQERAHRHQHAAWLSSRTSLPDETVMLEPCSSLSSLFQVTSAPSTVSSGTPCMVSINIANNLLQVKWGICPACTWLHAHLVCCGGIRTCCGKNNNATSNIFFP